MTDGRNQAHGPLTAVLDAGALALDAPSTLELRGPLDPALLEAALAHVAAEKPALREERPHILRHGPAHHTLHLTGLYPLGTLADLLTATPHHNDTNHHHNNNRDRDGDNNRDRDRDRDGDRGGTGSGGEGTGADGRDRGNDGGGSGGGWPRLPQVLEATALQQELLADIAAHPEHQVAQLCWRWHGPLDTGRFQAAWQSVFDREAVLRAAFVFDPAPRVALHAHARATVTRYAHGRLTRQALMEQERRRGFDPARPGMLRAALLEGAPPDPAGMPVPGREQAEAAPTFVLLTYHRGLLDGWSVRILVQEFYRAYLAGGPLPGAERRPDLRDYRRWLNEQDSRAARDLLTRQAPPACELPRARPGAVTGHSGTGRTRARLTRAEAARLTTWAARHGASESNALQAVWAMLLHLAGRHSGAQTVSFHVTVSGRGIPMEGITRLPGPLESPLPITLHVDPGAPVAALLQQARDQILDLSAYEWLTAGRIREWTNSPAPQTLLSFAHTQHPAEDLTLALAARHIHVEEPEPAGEHSAHPIGVLAHRDSMGCLVLTAVHDRARLPDDTAAALLARSARLLRQLPLIATENTTVTQALAGLGATAPVPAPLLYDPPAAAAPGLVHLRPPRQDGAGTVCLIASPGTPHTCHQALARHYPGPQALMALHPDAARVPHCLPLLAPHLHAHAPLVLGAFSGAGALAYELARHLATHCGRAPLVVLGAAAGDGDGQRGGQDADSGCESAVRGLAHAIAAAAAARHTP
ncbi:condensation domain-containing protein [Streptomyces aureocirculatus]|uniref:condensation domain-containing protein n=1 Tax=Streptomyces aureocirculatus TaxID=67275 RepID=UPI0007C45301|nr:condensation domain-containing protein [Streptomyces aureocirculatus]